MPVWHVSIGLGGKAIKEPGHTLEMQAKRTAVKILGKVGSGTVFWQIGSIAYHLRVAMSPKEIELLPNNWCDITPVDKGGDMRTIETWEV